MCGRAYHTYTEDELAARYFNEKLKKPFALDLKPNYNMAPTNTTPVIFMNDGEKDLGIFRWGLIPKWAKSIKDAARYSLINARVEEILEKRTYKDAYIKRRCIVPLTGFFEWKRTEEQKTPFAIHGQENEILSFAGIWEKWDDGENEIHSFSLLTTSANKFMSKIHDRMPVIIKASEEDTYMDPSATIEQIQQITSHAHSVKLEAYQISPLVNSPKNNRVEVLAEVNS